MHDMIFPAGGLSPPELTWWRLCIVVGDVVVHASVLGEANEPGTAGVCAPPLNSAQLCTT